MNNIKRSSGILMPITSLPSPYGVGTMGKAAFEYIDFLAKAKQTYWQILPVGPTGYGDSPYSSSSSFAGNPYLIDLDLLVKQKLLKKKELEGSWGEDEEQVDYDRLSVKKTAILRLAAQRGLAGVQSADREKFAAFVCENERWLSEYALFMAAKAHFKGLPWTEWPDEDLRLHKPVAVEKYRKELKSEIEILEYIQYLFYTQWADVKAYAQEKGIKIIGDLPIYVPLDSADVWSEPQWFQLDSDNRPVWVAGVPPDYFSEDGQLWGNPVYDWDKLRADGFGWWIRRISGQEKLYDVLRLDHFRGFESFWAVPADSKTAKNGHWVKGPGLDLIRVFTSWFANMSFIAEDLGILTPEVNQMLKDSGLPGMKVLEFAFSTGEPSDYLPHKYDKNCICYTGTHDNATMAQWFKHGDPKEKKLAIRYLGLNEEEGYIRGVIRGGMCSSANLFVAQMQDYLELGDGARTNVPGVVGGNWRWRMKKDAISKKLTNWIAETTALYGRAPGEK